MTFGDYRAMIEDSPIDTRIIEFRDLRGMLAGACLADALDDGYSAVFSFSSRMRSGAASARTWCCGSSSMPAPALASLRLSRLLDRRKRQDVLQDTLSPARSARRAGLARTSPLERAAGADFRRSTLLAPRMKEEN